MSLSWRNYPRYYENVGNCTQKKFFAKGKSRNIARLGRKETKAMKKQYATIGSVSSGTMRPQDLIPAFCWELRHYARRDKELTKIESRCNRALNGRYGENDKYFESEVCSWDLDTLFDMLNEYAPNYCYFGAHPGDGSDYGFWVSEDIEYDFDGLKVDDLSEVPAKYTGEVLQVNDHGNITLYNAKCGKFSEVWSIV